MEDEEKVNFHFERKHEGDKLDEHVCVQCKNKCRPQVWLSTIIPRGSKVKFIAFSGFELVCK